MFPETIPSTPPTDHDTQAARDTYRASGSKLEYLEWLQEVYHPFILPNPLPA